MYGINDNILFQCHGNLQNDSVWSCYTSYTLFDWKRFNLFVSNTVYEEGSHALLTELCFSGVVSMCQTHSVRNGEQATIHGSLLLLDT